MSNQKTNQLRLIAETAFHHQGEVDFLKKLVSSVINQSKADIVKFHLLLDLDAYMASDHVIYNQVKNWIFDKSVWREVIEEVNSSEKELMLLFNDTESIKFGISFQPTIVEIHSVCLNDLRLLNTLKYYLDDKIKVVLGVGGSDLYEIENAINILQHPNIILMFGFQNFPTIYQNVNFTKIRRIMQMFPDFEFGYADHTAWNDHDNILITLLGAALGMDYLEKHVTIAYGEERIDWSSAVSIEMFNEIKEKSDILQACNGDGLLHLNQGERDYSIFGPMKKAALLKCNVNAGEKFSMEMVSFKRTSQISDLSQVEVLQSEGRLFTKDVSAGKVISRAYLEIDKSGKLK